MKRNRQYVSPHHYSPSELLHAEIHDLETDIECARRDGLEEYAAECEAILAKKRALQGEA